MVKYIKQLLQLHSKVILPQFGAIVLSDEEAGTLMFNEYLTYDDGKILGLIKNEEKIDQEKAKKQIEQLIQEIQSELKKGASYSLGDLGVFTMDDDKVIFQGNLKSGKATPPPKKDEKESKEKASKKNVYVEKKEEASSAKDKSKKKKEDAKPQPKDKNSKSADKLKAEQKKAEKERLKKEKIEKKKAEKAKRLQEKEERKKKKLEAKQKKKEEKARLKKEKEEKKKAEKAKKQSKINKDKEAKTKKDIKKQPKSDKSAAVVSSSSSKKDETKKVGNKEEIRAKEKNVQEDKKKIEKEKKLAEKKAQEDKRKAEKEKILIEKREREKKKAEEKRKKKEEKERLKKEKSKKSTAAVKENSKTKPVKAQSKKQKKESKTRPIVWVLIVLLLLLIGGGIWVGLNYQKVETYMGWNQFGDAEENNTANKERSIPIIDSLETEEENDLENDTLNINGQTDSLTAENELESSEAVETEVSNTNEGTEPSAPVTSSSGDFHIIVGGFQVLSNAENMVQSLKNQGFNSSMLDGTRTGLELHFVSAQSYASLRDAKADLQRIKQSVNDGAWIYKD